MIKIRFSSLILEKEAAFIMEFYGNDCGLGETPRIW